MSISRTETTKRQWLLLILVIAVVARVGAAFYLGNEVYSLPGTYDQLSYHRLALRLVGGHGFSFGEPWWPVTAAGEPTAHWSFLYTAYLYAVYIVAGPNPLLARVLQAIIVGLLHPWLAYGLGRRLAGETVGFVAAGMTAVYIYFVYYTAALMTEPLYITSILGVLLVAMKIAHDPAPDERTLGGWRHGAVLGLLLGVTVLLRQLFLLVIPFLFLWLVWARSRQGRALPLGSIGVATVLIVVMIVPFTLYNYERFDRFVLLNTNAGYAFFWANHPIYGTQFTPILTPEMGAYTSLIPAELRHLDEAALDSALLERGLDFVIEDPGRYVLLSLSRIPAYFMFWPTTESSLISNLSRVLSFGLLWPFMLAGTVLTLWQTRTDRKRQNEIVLLLLFATLYTAIHLLSWALVRYRLPVDAVLLIPAALAVVRIGEWVANLPSGALSGGEPLEKL